MGVGGYVFERRSLEIVLGMRNKRICGKDQPEFTGFKVLIS